MLILEFGGKWFTDNTLCSYLSFASIIILHLKWSRDRKIPGVLYSRDLSLAQIHYSWVAQWAIFMEQKLRFGPVLGRLAILKKKFGQLWTTFEGGSFMLSWSIFFLLNIVAVKSCIKRLKCLTRLLDRPKPHVVVVLGRK